MPTQRSLTDIAAEIAQRKVPAVVIDTCVVFDVIRCAWRENPRVVLIAKQLIDAQQHGELLLYAHSAIQKEQSRNPVEREGEAQKKARDVDHAMEQYRQAASYLGVPYPHATGHSHESLITLLVALHEQLLSTCVHIVAEDRIKLAAQARASDNRRPASKGGGANDCVMFEEFRAIAHAVPAADPLVLFTTNPNDFEDRSKGTPVIHQDIENDLVGTKAQLCFNWYWAAKLVLSPARLKSI